MEGVKSRSSVILIRLVAESLDLAVGQRDGDAARERHGWKLGVRSVDSAA